MEGITQWIIFFAILATIAFAAPGILKVLLEAFGKGVVGLWKMFHKD